MKLSLDSVHHIALICADYARSKVFYTEILGLDVLAEHYREERDSWKLDLGLNGKYVLELFSFPDPPKRVSHPEAAGLRHLAFSVSDIYENIARLKEHGIEPEPVRKDPYTGKLFTFFTDPDDLPIEIYQIETIRK